MNFLDMEYRVDGGRALLQRAGLQLDVTALRGSIERTLKGRKLVLGIRPQHLRLAGDGAPADRPPDAAPDVPSSATHGTAPTLIATVDLVQPLARRMIVDLRADGQSLKLVLPGNAQVARGEALRLSFPLEHLHLFDSESGEALR